MSTPIGHIISIAAVRATSQPIARAWCTCGWEWRCSSGATHLAFSKGEEHAIQETYTPPVGDRHRPMPTVVAKEDS